MIQTIRDNLVEPEDGAARYVIVYADRAGNEWRGFERDHAATQAMVARIRRHHHGNRIVRVERSV